MGIFGKITRQVIWKRKGVPGDIQGTGRGRRIYTHGGGPKTRGYHPTIARLLGTACSQRVNTHQMEGGPVCQGTLGAEPVFGLILSSQAGLCSLANRVALKVTRLDMAVQCFRESASWLEKELGSYIAWSCNRMVDEKQSRGTLDRRVWSAPVCSNKVSHVRFVDERTDETGPRT